MVCGLLENLIAETGLSVATDVIQITDTPPILDTKLRAAETSAAVLGAQAALVCDIWRRRTGRRQTAALDTEGAALALQSVFYQRQWQYPIMAAEPSYPTVSIYATEDSRSIMINGGYPKLRDGLLDLLDSPDSSQAIRAAVAKWNAAELEEAAAERGLCAVQVRTPEEWSDHRQGSALSGTPVVEIIKVADGPVTPFAPLSAIYPPTGLRPLSGVRVLDLTHVIAGPTCAKILAEQGATVLHVYSPGRPHLPPFDMDTGHGKLSAFLDLEQDGDRKNLRELVRTADVFSQSYRPGAMAKFGFSAEDLARMRPGIVVVSCNCYGHHGPWQMRPGFEQLAQATTGIATTNGTPEAPRLAPNFYPNDYITGFLAAFGTLAALIRRAEEGGSYHVRVSLCRTAMLLLEQGLNPAGAPCAQVPSPVVARYMQETSSAIGRMHFLGPVLRYSETPSRWDLPPAPLGAHPPRWPDWE